MAKIKGESELTFMEAASIIVGHGVGAGILSVPYLAAHNSFCLSATQLRLFCIF